MASRQAPGSETSLRRLSASSCSWYQSLMSLASTARTSYPCSSRDAIRWPPMKPPAPVTNTFLLTSSSLRSPIPCFCCRHKLGEDRLEPVSDPVDVERRLGELSRILTEAEPQ